MWERIIWSHASKDVLIFQYTKVASSLRLSLFVCVGGGGNWYRYVEQVRKDMVQRWSLFLDSGIAEVKISRLKVSLTLVLLIHKVTARHANEKTGQNTGCCPCNSWDYWWEESNFVVETNFKACKGQKLNESCLNAHRRGWSPTC